MFVILLAACSKESDPKTLFDQGDYESALIQWQLLAEEGHPEAQNYLGIHYYLGLGVKRNLKTSRQWFEKAAINGFADAQYNFGSMYENGESVKQDFVTAYMWFYLALKNGNKNAERRMQTLTEEHKLFPNQVKRAVDLAKEYSN